MALGNEVTSLRAAATTLANGVVRALQVIGLLEAGSMVPPTPRGGAAGAPTPRVEPKGGASPTPRGGPSQQVESLQSLSSGRSIRVEDLLLWERAGNPLASKVARAWQRREDLLRKEGAATPTVLAALDRLLGAGAAAAQ